MKSAFKTIVLTKKCTQSCEFCSIYHQKLVSSEQEYTDFEANDAIQEAKNFFNERLEDARHGIYPVLWLSGGEPTVYPEIARVYNEIHNFLETEYTATGLFGICTNGATALPFYSKIFKNAWPEIIHTSIHGCADQHNAIVAYPKAFEASAKFRKEICQQPQVLQVVLQTCLTSVNVKDITFYRYLMSEALRLLHAHKSVTVQLTYPEGDSMQELPNAIGKYVTPTQLQQGLTQFFEVLLEVEPEFKEAAWLNTLITNDEDLIRRQHQMRKQCTTDFKIVFQGFPRCMLPEMYQEAEIIPIDDGQSNSQICMEAASASGNLFKLQQSDAENLTSYKWLTREELFKRYVPFCQTCKHLKYCNGFNDSSMLLDSELTRFLESQTNRLQRTSTTLF